MAQPGPHLGARLGFRPIMQAPVAGTLPIGARPGSAQRSDVCFLTVISAHGSTRITGYPVFLESLGRMLNGAPTLLFYWGVDDGETWRDVIGRKRPP